MRLYIYKNNFCDPQRNVGTCKLFSSAKDVDDYIGFFVASCKPESLKQFRAFVTNDNVEFHEVDHYALFSDSFGFQKTEKIKELDLLEISGVTTREMEARERRRKAAEELRKGKKQ